jgi:hypothetical protein
VQAVSFMFRDRLSAKDVGGVLSRFDQRPDEYGWVVLNGRDREMAVEIGEETNYDAMPPAIVKRAAQALGIRFGKPKTRLSVMYVDNEDDYDWQWVFQIARAFAERWKVVIYDHADAIYADLTPGVDHI